MTLPKLKRYDIDGWVHPDGVFYKAEDIQNLLREIFYTRLPTGVKVDELLSDINIPLWQRIYQEVNNG